MGQTRKPSHLTGYRADGRLKSRPTGNAKAKARGMRLGPNRSGPQSVRNQKLGTNYIPAHVQYDDEDAFAANLNPKSGQITRESTSKSSKSIAPEHTGQSNNVAGQQLIGQLPPQQLGKKIKLVQKDKNGKPTAIITGRTILPQAQPLMAPMPMLMKKKIQKHFDSFSIIFAPKS